MTTTEPRFLIVDLHKNKAVPATTDEMQALLRRVEPLTGEAYFEGNHIGDKNGFRRSIESVESRREGGS